MVGRATLLLSAAILATSSVAMAQEKPDEGFEVSVTIEGVEQEGLRRELRQVSSIYRGRDDFSSAGPVRRSVQSDAQAIRDALVSKGYYAATVEPSLTRNQGGMAVSFAVAPGRRFDITGYEVRYEDELAGRNVEEARRPDTLREAGIRTDGSPSGDQLQSIEQRLIQQLWSEGFPGATSLGRRVEANFETGEAIAVFPIETGPLARYGRVIVSGAERTDEDYIVKLRTFEAGEIYRRSEIDEYQEALAETGLFNEVQVSPAPPGYEGETDVLVQVTEREPRTVQAGLGYGTDIGPTAEVSWEHRNLFGGGEQLYTRAAASAPLQLAEVVFQKPIPILPGTWRLSTLAQNEDSDAYEARSISVTGAISKYWLERDLETIGGVRYQFTDTVRDPAGTVGQFSTVSFPLSAIFNNETDELNPVDGFRARALVEPFVGDVTFTKVSAGGATRFGFGDENTFLVAGRVLVGAAYGADRGEIPATERYYAGGGGSVRGYGYLEAGPINVAEQEDGTLVYTDGTPFAFEVDEDGRVTNDPVRQVGPIGGASIVEANIEARYRVTENIQAAAFVDTGTVFESQTPDFSGDFFTGVGVGVRYFTPIGPVRLDVALPLERRKFTAQRPEYDDDGNVVLTEAGEPVLQDETVFQDDIIGVYIALGQPF